MFAKILEITVLRFEVIDVDCDHGFESILGAVLIMNESYSARDFFKCFSTIDLCFEPLMFPLSRIGQHGWLDTICRTMNGRTKSEIGFRRPDLLLDGRIALERSRLKDRCFVP